MLYDTYSLEELLVIRKRGLFGHTINTEMLKEGEYLFDIGDFEKNDEFEIFNIAIITNINNKLYWIGECQYGQEANIEKINMCKYDEWAIVTLTDLGTKLLLK